jgi:hypothetical protein
MRASIWPAGDNMATNWKKSVSVRIGNGHTDIIRGPIDAFEALNNRWPAEHGPHYGHAKSMCSDAVARGSNDELTRDAFIGAALEAKVLD